MILHEKQETRVLPLYISNRTDYKTLDKAIKLLSHNLRNVLSALERLKEREGIGKVQDISSSTSNASESDPEPQFPNFLLLILYRIAEF